MTTICNHEWQPTEPHDLGEGYPGFECLHCEETTHPCLECGRAMGTSLLVCDRCLERAKRVVGDVAGWMTEHTFGVNLVTLRAVRYDRDRPGASDDARLPFGLDAVVVDPEDTRISALKHPDDAVAILRDWASSWADRRREVIGGDELGYLLDHTLWAIQNQAESDWTQFHDEARQVRAVVRRLLGIAPEREPVPCVHCGGRIVRDWTDDGLDDVRRCTRCGMEWETHARLLHTNALVLHALPETDPDTLATREQIWRVYPLLQRATLRLWIHRGHIQQRGKDVRGQDVYRLGDVAARMNQPDREAGEGTVA